MTRWISLLAVWVLSGCLPPGGGIDVVGPQLSTSVGPAPLPAGSPPPRSAEPQPAMCRQEFDADAARELKSATPIKPSAFSGCLSNTDRADSYRVTAPVLPHSRLYTVTLAPGASHSLCVAVFNADRERIARSCSSNGGASARAWFALAGGTSAYVRVYGYNSMPRGAAYSLEVASRPIADLEPNQRLEQAMLLRWGGKLRARFVPTANGPRQELDHYRIEIDRPATLQIALTDAPANVRFWLRIYDADGRRVGSTHYARNEGAALRVSVPIKKPGRYYVRVAGSPHRVAGSGAPADNTVQRYTISARW